MNNDIQHRLAQFEATPPARVWDAITAELDTETTGFSQRLYDFEAAPSNALWNRITTSLDSASEPAKIVPFYQRHSRAIRYASMAAAIFAGVILFNLFNKKAESDDVAKLPTVQQVQPAPPTANAPQKPTVAQTETPKEQQTISNTGKEIAVNNKPLPNRYMTVANNDGKAVRLSKKVYPVIDCAQKTEASTWSRCKESIQEMQAKMAAVVGTSDFGGLMDMIKSLEEKN